MSGELDILKDWCYEAVSTATKHAWKGCFSLVSWCFVLYLPSSSFVVQKLGFFLYWDRFSELDPLLETATVN